jgi:streptogramin lyase
MSTWTPCAPACANAPGGAARSPHRRGRRFDDSSVPDSVAEPTTTVPAAWTTDVVLRAPDGFVADAVLVDGDTVWVGGTQDGEGVVLALDRSGEVLESHPLRMPLRGLALGEETVWAWGGNDDGGGPAEVVVFDDGSVWVRNEQAPGTIARVDPTTGEVIERQPWSGPLLAAYGNQVRNTDGDGLLYVDGRTNAIRRWAPPS